MTDEVASNWWPIVFGEREAPTTAIVRGLRIASSIATT